MILDCLAPNTVPPEQYSTGQSWLRDPSKTGVILTEQETWVEPSPKVVVVTRQHKYLVRSELMLAMRALLISRWIWKLSLVLCPQDRILVLGHMFCFDLQLAVTERDEVIRIALAKEMQPLIDELELAFKEFHDDMKYRFLAWDKSVLQVGAPPETTETNSTAASEIPVARAPILRVTGDLEEFEWYLTMLLGAEALASMSLWLLAHTALALCTNTRSRAIR